MADTLPWLPWPLLAAAIAVCIAWARWTETKMPKQKPNEWPCSRNERFAAVYSAYLALRVSERLRCGYDALEPVAMRELVRQARAVAECAEKAE